MARSRSARKSKAGEKATRVEFFHRKTVRHRRLAMEFLEQRLLMAQDVWTGGGDGKTWQEYLAAHLGEPLRNFGVGGFGV